MMRYLIALALVMFLPVPALADITGQPRVIDGDTLEVAGQRIQAHSSDSLAIPWPMPGLIPASSFPPLTAQEGELAVSAAAFGHQGMGRQTTRLGRRNT